MIHLHRCSTVSGLSRIVLIVFKMQAGKVRHERGSIVTVYDKIRIVYDPSLVGRHAVQD